MRSLFAMARVIGLLLPAQAQSRQAETTAMPPLSGVDNSVAAVPQTGPGTPQVADVVYTHRVISALGGTYGYEILANDQVFIRQSTLPGRSGGAACPTAAKAEQRAQLVIGKLQSAAGPPTVTAAELIQLGL